MEKNMHKEGNQIEYIGIEAIENLGKILEDFQIGKVFLVTEKKLFAECGAKAYVDKIKNIEFMQFNDFGANPNIEDVNKGVPLFEQSKAGAIVALGGGSSIDTAKLIRHFSKRQVPLIAIPTTTGSGSEATSFAVMYVNKAKHSVADNSILPNVVIIDPILSASLPPYITAVTGMDALCHSIESYWSINSTDESKEYAKKAIAIILNSLEKTVHNPTVELRANMAKAANLAGKAINISKTTAAHAISYTLTSYFAIPHGLAVSLMLPDLLVYNYDVTEKDADDLRGVSYIKQSLDEINHLFGGKDSRDTRAIIEQFINKLGLSTELSFYGIKYSDIDLILDNINSERLNNNPRRVEKGEVRKMLELKFYG
jgi:alcohol dehydrogenase class IV